MTTTNKIRNRIFDSAYRKGMYVEYKECFYSGALFGLELACDILETDGRKFVEKSFKMFGTAPDLAETVEWLRSKMKEGEEGK